MHFGNIKEFSIENGPGVRVSLFVSGCRNHCPGCFSSHTWDFTYGLPYTEEITEEIIRLLNPAYMEGLTVLGGEPMEPENQRDLIPILRRIRQACPDRSIWCYTGFTWEELHGASRGNTPHREELLSLIDVLVDGRFVEAQRNLSLAFRGSENQRILDVKKSLKACEAVWWEKGGSR